MPLEPCDTPVQAARAPSRRFAPTARAILWLAAALGACGTPPRTDLEETNHPPALIEALIQPSRILPLGMAKVSATAMDADGDPLTFSWTATAGTFADPHARVTTYQAPAEPQTVTLVLEVSDTTSRLATAFALDIVPEDSDPDGDGFVADDCAPASPTSYPGADEIPDGVDNDCDGTVDEGTTAHDDDEDGFAEVDGDCDDADPDRHPGAIEASNGADDDCDGTVDEGTIGRDDDGDGFAEVGGDCDDSDPSVYPGAEEQHDGRDDNCDGTVDEGTIGHDDDHDGFSELDGDCDDRSPAIYPGAPEILDGLDEDCDGLVDETTERYDDDGDGQSEEDGDCDDTDPHVRGGWLEVADGTDNDCDGLVDEGTPLHDDDGDGFSEIDGDCDDTDPWTFPGAITIPDDPEDRACASLAPLLVPAPSVSSEPDSGCATWVFTATLPDEPLETSILWRVVQGPAQSRVVGAESTGTTFEMTPDRDGRYEVQAVGRVAGSIGPPTYVTVEVPGCG